MMPQETISPIRRRIGLAVFAIVALAALGTTLLTLNRLSTLPRTTDASISAEIAHIAAGLPGRIKTVAVRNNQSVTMGQLLFELDARTYELQRDQAQAQVEAASAALSDAGRLSKAQASNAQAATAEIGRAKSNLALARATVVRLTPLARDGIASKQTLDEAVTAEADARVSLDVAQKAAEAAQNLITTTDSIAAELRSAQAALALAEHMLERTRVTAPFAGKVTGLSVTVGTWVVPELPVFTLIDDASWYAEAYFRETDLAAIHPGQPASVRVLSNQDQPLTGRISSIGWGVQTTDSLDFAGRLPFVAQTTDWVRLAKRFPVRIEFDGPPPDFFRVGASATVVLVQR